MKSLSFVQLFETPRTVAYQAPPSMGFSRQEYWSGLPFPSPGDLPDPGTTPMSPASPALAPSHLRRPSIMARALNLAMTNGSLEPGCSESLSYYSPDSTAV